MRESLPSAALAWTTPRDLALSGSWTARGLGAVARRSDAVPVPDSGEVVVDATQITGLDTAGAWILRALLKRLREAGCAVTQVGLSAEFQRLLDAVAGSPQAPATPVTADGSRFPASVERLGRGAAAAASEAAALVAFVGESALALAAGIAHPSRLRWRPVLYNLRTAGVDALPIVGLLAFLLGVVVAYQGAEPLERYGANIFVADLVGLSMLREFAPLVTAVIVAGRSGSAYAAQIGTMSVTEEIDAMRTVGIAPLEMLVLPKILAMVIALPLLTVLADVLGVFGGMTMARARLGIGFEEFLDRFVKAASLTTFFVGLFKAPVFAVIITTIGCFQGFRASGGADSVGRQTTRSVVQAIFLVIVADALFSVAFSLLSL